MGVPGLGQEHGYIDGRNVLFHDYCWPMDGYRLPS
jgi:hypothetical protein